jgi:hypothetical protein
MDITPTPSMYVPVVNTAVGNFDQVHTCRDLGKLREWVAQRYANVNATATNQIGVEMSEEQEIPAHGYVLNDDARLPWDRAHDEYR